MSALATNPPPLDFGWRWQVRAHFWTAVRWPRLYVADVCR
jgi:hypothetical protein